MNSLNVEEQQVLYLIKNDADQARYFFARAKALKWFYPLKGMGFFFPEQIKYDQNKNALFWDILDYLERVSEQVTQDSIYGKELIDIIAEIVRFSNERKEKGKGINNYHIWWYCVKILNNIPTEIIKKNLPLEDFGKGDQVKYGFRTWLVAWTEPFMNTDLTISDIGELLLKKFLKDDAIEYAEAILELMTGIKIDTQRRGIDNKYDVVLKWNSYYILKPIQQNKDMIAQKCSADIIYHIADKLKRTLEYKNDNYHVNIWVGDDCFQIKVCRVLENSDLPREITFKKNSYKCEINKYPADKIKGIDRGNDWLLHDIVIENDPKAFTLTGRDKNSFVNSLKENLPKEFNNVDGKVLDKKLRLLFEGIYEDYSQIWCKSLKDFGSEHENGAEEVLTVILRDILIARIKNNVEEGKNILESFLGDTYKFPIYQKLVLFSIDTYWEYKDIFNVFLENIPNALDKTDYEVELYDLLKNHSKELSAQKENILKLISTVPEYYIEKEEKYQAYWQYKWLSALKDNTDFSKPYEDAKKKAEIKDDTPFTPDRTEFAGGWIVNKSPLSRKEILQKPIFEVVKLLNDFQETDASVWKEHTIEEGPNKRGFAEELYNAVKEEPKKFTDEIELFQGTSYLYIHQVLRGFHDAWNDNKDLDWKKIFDFCLKYLDKKKDVFDKEVFQAQGDDSGDGRYIWLISTVADLIDNGCRNDNRAFSPEYFSGVERLFTVILPLLKEEKPSEKEHDAVTYALNTSLGKIAAAYLTFSLRAARVNNSREENWGQNKYDRFLKKGIEGYVWLGHYLINFNYLDSKYVQDKIAILSDQPDSDLAWQMFMEGFLTTWNISKELYKSMRPHYLKALESNTFGRKETIDDTMGKKLINHICFGYLNGEESLQEKNADNQSSLFWKALIEIDSQEKKSRWLETIDAFWSQSDKPTRKKKKESDPDKEKQIRQNIVDFWKWTYDNQDLVRNKLGDDYNAFLGKIAKLTVFLDKIDENKKAWLLLSTPYVDALYETAFFIECLTRYLDGESVRNISVMYRKLLENSTPTYKDDNIRLIVERMYQIWEKDKEANKEVKSNADEICNTYGRRGVHFLRDLWEKNNPVAERK